MASAKSLYSSSTPSAASPFKKSQNQHCRRCQYCHFSPAGPKLITAVVDCNLHQQSFFTSRPRYCFSLCQLQKKRFRNPKQHKIFAPIFSDIGRIPLISLKIRLKWHEY